MSASTSGTVPLRGVARDAYALPRQTYARKVKPPRGERRGRGGYCRGGRRRVGTVQTEVDLYVMLLLFIASRSHIAFKFSVCFKRR